MKTSSHFLLAIISYSFAAVILSAQPVVQLNNSTFDVGTIYHGEVKTIPLIVSNKGNQPLIITNVETSCGCTSARKSVPPISPGSADTIIVSFNSLGYNCKITKSITIQSNDAVKPYVQAQLIGTVTSIMESVPWTSVINFGGSAVGVKTTAALPCEPCGPVPPFEPFDPFVPFVPAAPCEPCGPVPPVNPVDP